MKCKRSGCDKRSLPYDRYGGCCSLYCRDLQEQDNEIDLLKNVLIIAKIIYNAEFSKDICSYDREVLFAKLKKVIDDYENRP